MNLYDTLYEVNNTIDGIWFEKIEGFSLLGDIRSGAQDHPIQYRAITNTRPGDDDPFEGMGWTPLEAVRNLLKALKEDYPEEDED